MKLGNPNGARALNGKQVGNKEAVAAVKANAEHRAANLKGHLDDLRSQGIKSVRTISYGAECSRHPYAARWHVASDISRTPACAPKRIAQLICPCT